MSIPVRQLPRLRLLGALLVMLGSMLLVASPARVSAQTPEPGTWSAPENVSESDTASLYPDLAVDSAGKVYVVWAEWNSDHEGRADKLMLRMKDAEGWSQANDIALTAHLPQIEVDSAGRLHLISSPAWYSGAWAQDEPNSAWAWSKPTNLAWRDAYWPRLLVDESDRIFAVFKDTMQYDQDRTISDARRCKAGCSGVYLTRSTDGGDAWMKVTRLDTPDLDASEPYLAVGQNDDVFAIWADDDASEYAVALSFARSSDGGQTWEPPVQLADGENRDNAQIVVDSAGRLHVIWRQKGETPGIGYMRSSDDGKTWTREELLEAPITGAYSLGFAVDAADTLHLVVALNDSEGFKRGVYHFERPAGGRWLRPQPVAQNTCSEGADDIELAISQGNRLHAVWYERLECRLGFAPPSGRGEVFYSSFISDAPETPAAPLPAMPEDASGSESPRATAPAAPRASATLMPTPVVTPAWSTAAQPGGPSENAGVAVGAGAAALAIALGAVAASRLSRRK